jgi:hypothetical protein
MYKMSPTRQPNEGCQSKHKVGYGSVLVVDTNRVLTGTLGEGPGRNGKELCFACIHWGLAQLRVDVPVMGPL